MILLLTLAILKFAVMDQPIRHQRLWQEFRLIATLSERERIYDTAKSFHGLALKEARKLGENNIRDAISLADSGVYEFRLKNYSKSLKYFTRAESSIKNLLLRSNFNCDPRLVAAENARISVHKARCLEASGQVELSRKAFLVAIKACENPITQTGVSDRICADRFIESFESYCRLSRALSGDSAAKDLLTKIDWKKLSPQLSDWRRDQMRALFGQLLKASIKNNSAKRDSLLASFNEAISSSNQNQDIKEYLRQSVQTDKDWPVSSEAESIK